MDFYRIGRSSIREPSGRVRSIRKADKREQFTILPAEIPRVLQKQQLRKQGQIFMKSFRQSRIPTMI